MGKVMHGDKTRAGASRLYSIWCDMKRRCIDPSRRNYKHYGGKGVRVCGEWLSYTAFKAWALSSGYKDNLTIDRLDSNGDYEPKNCRWVTLSENIGCSNRAKHRRPKGFVSSLRKLDMGKVRKIRLLYKNNEGSMLSLARKFGVAASTIYQIIHNTRYKEREVCVGRI